MVSDQGSEYFHCPLCSSDGEYDFESRKVSNFQTMGFRSQVISENRGTGGAVYLESDALGQVV